MILLTSKTICTLKSRRTCEPECVCLGKFACVPYINMFQHVPRALVCAILTVGNTECYLFIYFSHNASKVDQQTIGTR